MDLKYVTEDMIQRLLERATPGERRVFDWDYLCNKTRAEAPEPKVKEPTIPEWAGMDDFGGSDY